MTPQEHRDAAAAQLAYLDELSEAPSEQRVRTQAAIAHALLGLLEVQISKQVTGIKHLNIDWKRDELAHVDIELTGGQRVVGHVDPWCPNPNPLLTKGN